MRLIVIFGLLLIRWQAFGQPYGMGLTFDDKQYEKAPIPANYRDDNHGSLPRAYSLKKYSPLPGNQLQLNTAPAWATAWSALTILEARRHGWTDRELVTRNTYSPAFTYFHIKPAGDKSCEAGASLYDALEFLKYNGAIKYLDFLEFCPKKITGNPASEEMAKITDFRKLFDWNASKKEKIIRVKRSISANLPVVIGMYCPPSFLRAKSYWQPTEMMNTDMPGHALCVVGYDDEKYGGAFEVINSWGHEWGNGGFMWVRYGDFADFVKYAYEIFDINKSEKGFYEFSGEIRLRLHTQEGVPVNKVEEGIYEIKQPFPTGTFFRIMLKHDGPVFMYVFGYDRKNEFFRIFPHLDNISPAIIYENGLLNVPGEDNYIEITGEPGREQLCVLFSKVPIDFKQLLAGLEKYQGDIMEKLNTLMDGKVIDPLNARWHENEIKFDAKSVNKSAMLIRITIDHL